MISKLRGKFGWVGLVIVFTFGLCKDTLLGCTEDLILMGMKNSELFAKMGFRRIFVDVSFSPQSRNSFLNVLERGFVVPYRNPFRTENTVETYVFGVNNSGSDLRQLYSSIIWCLPDDSDCLPTSALFVLPLSILDETKFFFSGFVRTPPYEIKASSTDRTALIDAIKKVLSAPTNSYSTRLEFPERLSLSSVEEIWTFPRYRPAVATKLANVKQEYPVHPNNVYGRTSFPVWND